MFFTGQEVTLMHPQEALVVAFYYLFPFRHAFPSHHAAFKVSSPLQAQNHSDGFRVEPRG